VESELDDEPGRGCVVLEGGAQAHGIERNIGRNRPVGDQSGQPARGVRIVGIEPQRLGQVLGRRTKFGACLQDQSQVEVMPRAPSVGPDRLPKALLGGGKIASVDRRRSAIRPGLLLGLRRAARCHGCKLHTCLAQESNFLSSSTMGPPGRSRPRPVSSIVHGGPAMR